MTAPKWAVLLALALTALACGHSETPRFIMATSFTRLVKGPDQAEARRVAIASAENLARDQVLSQALEMRFSNGISLGEAALKDPFIRAKLYDTVRAARVTDKTVTDDEIISVTVRLELEPIYSILENYPAPDPTI